MIDDIEALKKAQAISLRVPELRRNCGGNARRRERVKMSAGGKATENLMNDCKRRRNESIKCTVTQCSNHCSSSDYCSLPEITVGTHEANPTMSECTDCNSFRLRG